MTNLFKSYSSLSTITDTTIFPVVDSSTGQNGKITGLNIKNFVNAIGATGPIGIRGATGPQGIPGPIIPATTTTLGAIIAGHNLAITTSGVLSSVLAVVGDTPPANPLPGDQWWDSEQGRGYVFYNGQWVEMSPNVSSGGIIGTTIMTLYMTPTPPTTVYPGALWYDTTGGRTYILYDDFWVDASPSLNYILPAATTSTLGGVKVDGTTITIDNGVISSIGGGGTPTQIVNGTSNVNIATANGPVTVKAGSADSWTFGIDSTLTAPNGTQILSAGPNFNILTAGHDGAIQFFTDSTDNNYTWVFDGYGYTSLPGTFGYPPNTGVITQQNAGSIIISVGSGPTREFKFGSDGVLTLPEGGDIVDSTGISVLGGGGTTTNWLAVPSDIIPADDLTYNLGSPSKQWGSLYVGTATIYIGGVPLTLNTVSNTLVIGTSTNTTATGSTNLATENFVIQQIENISGGGPVWQLTTSSGATVTLTNGSLIDGGNQLVISTGTYITFQDPDNSGASTLFGVQTNNNFPEANTSTLLLSVGNPLNLAGDGVTISEAFDITPFDPNDGSGGGANITVGYTGGYLWSMNPGSTGTVQITAADPNSPEYTWVYGTDGALTLPRYGVIRNNGPVNIVSNEFAQLQWTTAAGAAEADPNGTSKSTNWVWVESDGVHIETNVNNYAVEFIGYIDNGLGGESGATLHVTDIIRGTITNGMTIYGAGLGSSGWTLTYGTVMQPWGEGLTGNYLLSGANFLIASQSFNDGNSLNSNNWKFNNYGQTILPLLTTQRGDNPSGTISGYTLNIGDGSHEAIITTPDGNETYNNSQRLVINPGKGADGTYGEGGDIYLWAGRGGDAGGTGGDIKIRGGQGMANQAGGYIRIEGGDGDGTGEGGYIHVQPGITAGPNPGYVHINGGQNNDGNGGAVVIAGGYSAGGTGGTVSINGGVSSLGVGSYGNVNIVSGASTWAFDNTGMLTAPGNMLKLSSGSSIAAENLSVRGDIGESYAFMNLPSDSNANSMPAHLGNDNGNVQITALSQANGVSQYWVFDTAGHLTLPTSGSQIIGDVTFTGAVTFSNTATYINSTNTVYTDNLLELHTHPDGINSVWTVDDGRDIGFRFHYYTTTDTNAALVLANDTKYLEWYSSGVESTASGVISGGTYGTFKTGSIKLVDITTATSTTTGALVVTGGVGVGGSLYAKTLYDNSNRVVTSVTPTAGTGISIASVVSTGTATSFTVSNTGVVTLTAGTDTSISNSTGNITIWNNSTLQTITGRGATTDQAISITNTTAATSTTTGALKITGGVGIGGSLYVKGTITASSGAKIAPRVISTTTTTTLTWSSDNSDQQNITGLTSALTIGADTGTPVAGQKMIFYITDNGTNRTLTWNTGTNGFKEIGVTLPTSTTANKITYVGCIYNAINTKWDVIAIRQEA